MVSGSRSSRLVLALALVALLAAAIALVTLSVVTSSLRSRAEQFRDRSLLYATTIASSLPAWVARSESPDLDALEGYAAFAGLLYIQVASGEAVLLEVSRLPGAEELLRETPQAGESRATLRTVLGTPLADVVVTYVARLPHDDASSFGSHAIGTLRLGVDASALAWLASGAKALAAGLAALIWAFLAGLVGSLTWRTRTARGEQGAPDSASAQGRVLECGRLALYVDEARWVVDGRSISLTRKQLDLVKVLMSEPGRTFSDQEIIQQAWPGSLYADFRDVKQCVYLVRRRLRGAGLEGSRVVSNVPGVGYRVDPEAVAEAVTGNDLAAMDA